MPRFLLVVLSLVSMLNINAQAKLEKLTVEKIMRDPKWMGTSPSNPQWSADGKMLFFSWNPDKAASDSLYYITESNKTPQKASVSQKQDFLSANNITYNKARTAYVYSKDGDIFYKSTGATLPKRITKTTDFENGPQFCFSEKKIAYSRNNNLYAWDTQTGETEQLTNIRSGSKPASPAAITKEEEWMKADQLKYFEVLKTRKERREAAETYSKNTKQKELRTIYIDDKSLNAIDISPDGRFISYRLYKSASNGKSTIIPSFVTESGFTTDIPGRTKVGAPQGAAEMFLYDRDRDSVIRIITDSIPGIRDIPAFVNDYPSQLAERKKLNAVRPVDIQDPIWSVSGKQAVIDVFSEDNKDRWILLLDTATKTLKLIDRQHNEAWIGGPGIYGNEGWIDENNFWYQSEANGYTHIYITTISTGQKRALTSGDYEVQEAALSNDKKSFFITSNEVHPGEKQFYKLNIATGKQERLTSTTGANQVSLSPDEKSIAILYSYFNKPWELFLQSTKTGAKSEQITTKAQSEEFKSYAWREPELISFKASDGAMVYGRLYKPSSPHPNNPAVMFVHGAGYLQNAHKWWSSYFREYMFNNLLADNGYVVFDIDYRGSAGYGRDWRTGIYRYMGGKDLSDHVDAANFLVKNYGVNPAHIGLYGGSYGGFITLMALFTAPNSFTAGAALRPVTDWANYNHQYTSNILNEPFNDSIAYRRSSPYYFAEGLKGNLLICHGMIDVNVHFQDAVKLSQRLIELGKDNWNLAAYPMEDHGFVEPSSWTDEYKRIFHLFETVLKK